ncbi:hypothetical protein ACTFIU_006080 [Dictyostelium citrinum]
MDIPLYNKSYVYYKKIYTVPIILGFIYNSWDYLLISITTLIGCFIFPYISTGFGLKLSIIISFLTLSSISIFLKNDHYIITQIFSPIIKDFLLICCHGYIINISDKSNIGTLFGLFFSSNQILYSILKTFPQFYESNILYTFFGLILFIGLLLSMNINIPNTLETIETLSNNNNNNNIIELIKTQLKLIRDKKFLNFIPIILFIGYNYQLLNLKGSPLFSQVGVSLISFGGNNNYKKYNHFIKPSNLFSNISMMLMILIYSISSLNFKDNNSIHLVSVIKLFQTYGTLIALILSKWITLNSTFFIFIILFFISFIILFKFINKHSI